MRSTPALSISDDSDARSETVNCAAVHPGTHCTIKRTKNQREIESIHLREDGGRKKRGRREKEEWTEGERNKVIEREREKEEEGSK